jgi:phage baseplate assembly protein V
MDLSHLNRALQPLMHRIKLAVSRGKVRLVYKGNAYKTQRLQVELLAGELSDVMEHFEPYGFTASPVLGAEALVHFLGGNRAHGIAGVVSDGRSRPRTLSEGEVAIYHCSDDPEASAEEARHRITLTAGKIILRVDALDIKCGPSTLQMDAAGIRLAGPRIDLN